MKANNHTFIDSETYEIIPDSKIIEVDDDIAEAISLLNKKGYKTKYCCSGHANKHEYYSGIICDKSLIDEKKFKEDYIEYYIDEIDKNNFRLIYPKKFTGIYIMFVKDYNFNNLPVGFEKIPIWDEKENKPSSKIFDTIEHIVNYYDKGKLRNDNEVQKEINKYNELLLEWVRKLPDINERND